MTPAQKNALEGLAGRTLTGEEYAAIDMLLPSRNDVAIASLLPPAIMVSSKPIGVGTVLAVMAPYGGDFLNALEAMGDTDGNVKWTLRLIEKSDFDVGLPVTRIQLQAFADAQPALADGIAALLSVAEVIEPITTSAVSDVLNIAEGRMTLGG